MAGPSKNSRVVRRVAEPVKKDRTKFPFWVFPFRPGTPVKPLEYFETEEEAERASANYQFETRVGSWGSLKR